MSEKSLPPVALVVGITPGETRVENCYLCDKPVLVSISVAADLRCRASSLEYAHASCHIDMMKKLMELHGVSPSTS